jgi:hypothetical protein
MCEMPRAVKLIRQEVNQRSLGPGGLETRQEVDWSSLGVGGRADRK